MALSKFPEAPRSQIDLKRCYLHLFLSSVRRLKAAQARLHAEGVNNTF